MTRRMIGSGSVRYAAGLVLGLLAVSSTGLAQFNVAILGGYAGGIAKSAIPDYDATRWGGTKTYGATLNYRFHNGLSLGFRAEQMTLRMTEDGDHMGDLKLRPLMAAVGYQTRRPETGRGFGGHAQFGGGIALTEFETGAAINAIASAYHGNVDVTVNRAPVFEAGGGVDYFLNRWVSITSDFRLVMSNVGTRWRVSVGNSYSDMDWNKLYASTGQVLGGVRFWLK